MYSRTKYFKIRELERQLDNQTAEIKNYSEGNNSKTLFIFEDHTEALNVAFAKYALDSNLNNEKQTPN